MPKESNRIHYFSLMSVLSALAVVTLHVNGCFWNYSTEIYWPIANLIESVCYFAVPIFFMTTGATLIDYRDRYTTKQYAKKRIQKTLLPFLFWSFMGVVYIYLKLEWEFIPSVETFKNILLGVLNVEYVSIFWFFVSLFEAYLCIPLFASVTKEMRIRVFSYVIILAFILHYLIPFLCTVFNFNYYNRVGIGVGDGYLMYVLLGYVLSKISLSKKHRFIIYALSIFGFLMHLVGTYVLSTAAGTVISTYKGYVNVPCALYSIGVFVFLKEVGSKLKNEKIISIIEKLSSYTFALYLLHWFIIDFSTHIFTIDITSIWYRLLGPIIISAICIAIAWLIRKIPILKAIIP